MNELFHDKNDTVKLSISIATRYNTGFMWSVFGLDNHHPVLIPQQPELLNRLRLVYGEGEEGFNFSFFGEGGLD